MEYIDIDAYPLVKLIDKEIYALDDWREKQKLAQSRTRRRRFWHVMNILVCALWVVSVILWHSDLQMLTLVPAVYVWINLGLDLARYDLTKLNYEAVRAKNAYEISLQCTLGAQDGTKV